VVQILITVFYVKLRS